MQLFITNIYKNKEFPALTCKLVKFVIRQFQILVCIIVLPI